jgi:hypothetical protein
MPKEKKASSNGSTSENIANPIAGQGSALLFKKNLNQLRKEVKETKRQLDDIKRTSGYDAAEAQEHSAAMTGVESGIWSRKYDFTSVIPSQEVVSATNAFDLATQRLQELESKDSSSLEL